jgi:hypothetical protein
MNLVTMAYGKTAIPKDYVCRGKGCGAERVKLWRHAGFELTTQKLYCLACVLPLLGIPRDQVDSLGRHRTANQKAPTARLRARSSMECPDAIPAIPHKIREDGETLLYLDFRSASYPALRWWDSLPLSN